MAFEPANAGNPNAGSVAGRCMATILGLFRATTGPTRWLGSRQRMFAARAAHNDVADFAGSAGPEQKQALNCTWAWRCGTGFKETARCFPQSLPQRQADNERFNAPCG